tara:strand:- start:339 stop:593 length:255 start_codon:yes stop_codon:yes gene_type:complete
MNKRQLYEMAEEAGITNLLKAAAEFERKECEKICRNFAMNEKRIEVSAALNRSADLIRLRAADNSDIMLADRNTPKDFITYIED